MAGEEVGRQDGLAIWRFHRSADVVQPRRSEALVELDHVAAGLDVLRVVGVKLLADESEIAARVPSGFTVRLS